METVPNFSTTLDALPISVFNTNAEVGQAAASDAAAFLRQTLQERGHANVILATGNSQLTFLESLRCIPGIGWSKVNVFHMDEYIDLEVGHPASFPAFLRRHFLDHLQPPAGAFFPVPGERAEAGCQEYEALLRAHPCDLCALGIGENGHLAFNDPPYADFDDRVWVKVIRLDEASRRQQVGEGHFPNLDSVPMRAMTLTIPALLSARKVLAIVPEGRKAPAVQRALHGPIETNCPASILRRAAHAHLYLDRDSAALAFPNLGERGRMKTIRWGIIGCGNVTEVKSGPGFQKAEGSRLVAVMRRNAELAKDYARRHDVPKWYADAQALIDDPEVDAVYIATPPNSHCTYTLAVARAGKPVYVEKPMALNAVECQEMVNACRTAGTPLFVAYYRRALPRFLKAKELVTGGTIGEVRFVEITLTQPLEVHPPDELPWRLRPEIAGGGLFVDLASHTLDFLDFVLGPVRRTRGFARNQAGAYPAEDIVSAAFQFENGVQAVGTWCFSSFEAADRLTFVGSGGKVTLSMFGNEPVRLETSAGTEVFDLPNPPHVQQPLIQQVVNELLGMGSCVSTGESAMRTSWVMDQLLRERTS